MVNSSKYPKVVAIKLFLTLATIEGIFCLFWLTIIPSDSKTAWLFGFSRYRILLLLGALVGTTLFVGLLIRSWRNPSWNEWMASKIHVFFQNKWRKITFWVITLLILYLGIAALWIASKDHWTIWVLPSVYLLGDYLSRLFPLLLWIVLLGVQTLVMIWLLGYRLNLGLLILYVFSVLIYPSLWLFFSSLHPNYYVVINREDYIIEWLTVVFLVLAAVMAFIHFLKARTRSDHYGWFFVIFAVVCIFFAIEEISWGQRIFGLEVSEFFLNNSDQPEINLHNVINEQFSVRTKHLAAIGLFSYGVILPISAGIPWIRSLAGKFRIVIPSKVLIPGFTLASLITWDRYFNGQDEEVAEFFFSTLLFLSMVFYFWESREITGIKNLGKE